MHINKRIKKIISIFLIFSIICNAKILNVAKEIYVNQNEFTNSITDDVSIEKEEKNETEEMIENEEVDVIENEKDNEDICESENISENEIEKESEEICETEKIEEKEEINEIIEIEETEEDVVASDSIIEINVDASDEEVIIDNSSLYVNETIFFGANEDTPVSFVDGKTFNLKVKKLINPEISSCTEDDYDIQHIKRANEAPDNSINKVEVSTNSEIGKEIFVWFDNTNNTLYYYSSVTHLLANKDSSYMFANLSNVQSIDISEIDFSNVEDMSYMFYDDYELGEIEFDLKHQTNNLKNMEFAFAYVNDVEEIDLFFAKIDSNISLKFLFFMCSNLKKIIVSDAWNISSVTDENKKYMYKGVDYIKIFKRNSVNEKPLETGEIYEETYKIQFNTYTDEVIATISNTVSQRFTLPNIDRQKISYGEFYYWDIGGNHFNIGDKVNVEEVISSADENNIIYCDAICKYDDYYSIVFQVDSKYYEEEIDDMFLKTSEEVIFPNILIKGVDSYVWVNKDKDLRFNPGDVYVPTKISDDMYESLCSGIDGDNEIIFKAEIIDKIVDIEFVNVKPNGVSGEIEGQQSKKKLKAIDDTIIANEELFLDGYKFEGYSLNKECNTLDACFGMNMQARDLLQKNESAIILYSVFGKVEQEKEKRPEGGGSSSGGGGGGLSFSGQTDLEKFGPQMAKLVKELKDYDGWFEFDINSNKFKYFINDNNIKTYAANRWISIPSGNDKAWYLFNEKGYLMTGLVNLDGVLYYFSDKPETLGQMMTGFIEINNEKLFFNSDGVYADALEKIPTTNQVVIFDEQQLLYDNRNNEVFSFSNTKVKTTVTIINGEELNKKIKNLAGKMDNAKIDTENINIKHIVFEKTKFDKGIDVGDVNDKNKIFINYDEDNETLIFSSLVDEIYMPFDCSHMFQSLKSLIDIDLKSFNFIKAHSMQSMFFNCSSLENIHFKNNNLFFVTDFSNMFEKCSKLSGANFYDEEVYKVENANRMFAECYGTKIIVNGFNFDATFEKSSTYFILNFYPNSNVIVINDDEEFKAKLVGMCELVENHPIFMTKNEYLISNYDVLTLKFHDGINVKELKVKEGQDFIMGGIPDYASEKDGYYFLGWSKVENAEKADYFTEIMYEAPTGDTLDLYAIYLGMPVCVSYFENGKTLKGFDMKVGDSFSVNYNMNKQFYKLLGYDTNVKADTVVYSIGDTIKLENDENIYLYPVWKREVYFISDLILKTSEKPLSDAEKGAGWNWTSDLRCGGGGHFIYLGYKTTENIHAAITNIIVDDVGYSREGNHLIIDGEKYYATKSIDDPEKSVDLNKGTRKIANKFLLYSYSSAFGTPIVDIKLYETYDQLIAIDNDNFFVSQEGMAYDILYGLVKTDSMKRKKQNYLKCTKFNEKGVIDPTPSRIVFSNNWMSKIPNETMLHHINIPGTHDAACNEFTSIFVTGASKTQYKYIDEQLEAGARLFDLRLGYNKSSGVVTTYHGFSAVKCAKNGELYTLDKILNECIEFLSKNPTETIICRLRCEVGKENIEEFRKRTKEVLDKYKSHLYQGEEVPKISDVRGKIVTISPNLYDWDPEEKIHRTRTYLGITCLNMPDETKGLVVGRDITEKLKDDNSDGSVSAEEKISILKMFFERNAVDKNRIPKDFTWTWIDTSCYTNGFLMTVHNQREICATEVNKFILGTDKLKTGYIYGWYGMDYIYGSLMKRIYDLNFK